MKFRANLFFLLLSSIMILVIFPKPSSAQQGEVSFQVFYDELSPYGDWINYQNYGYAWIPNVEKDFVPYSTAGYWLLTDYGWTWMSDYDWGWAPFHYGRWDYDNYYGWLWIPDNEWGPSWVNWRSADGYYGWSPMEPGISLSIGFGRQFDRNNDHWIFVRNGDFERHDLGRYSVNRSNHEQIFRNSTAINTTHIDNRRHTTYVTGPAREEVQRVTGQSINPVTIRENRQPGQVISNGQLQIYRPQVKKDNSYIRKPAPARISDLNEVKRPSERTGITQPSQQSGSSAPVNNNVKQQQPVSKPQNTNTQRPTQQRAVAPVNNNVRQQQPFARPQNTNTQQPTQQRAVTPNGVNPKQQQPAARPQNTNTTRSTPQKIAAPARNNRQQQPQNNSRPQIKNTNEQPRGESRSENEKK